jgi:tRNA(Ile)-lysidine synthase
MSPAFLEGAEAAGKLLSWVLDYARQQELFGKGDRVLVAVSGGPDSVALLHLLHRLQGELGLKLAVGHFDHQLRGQESQEDAAFVADRAQGLGLACHLGRGPVRDLARAEKVSLQMAGRRLRLNFLRDTCRDHAYGKVALGHTADDQVELFWLRLLRGAGPVGLKGMWPAAPDLVRPLLAVGKSVLLAWLEQEGLSYRLDPSNLSRRYVRNRIRLDLLPELEKGFNPHLRQAIWRTQALLQEDETVLAQETVRAWAAVGKTLAPEVFALNLPGFFTLVPALQKRLLRHTVGRLLGDRTLTAPQVDSLLALARGEKSGGRMDWGEDLHVARAGPELHFFRPLPPPPGDAVTLLPDCPAEVDSPAGWRWRLRGLAVPAGNLRPPGPETAWLDAAQAALPLEVRYFRPGDRFWPAGAPGPKKLQDFLVDCKAPRWLRPYLPLVVSGGRIIWVPGLRVAESVQATAGSHTRLELEVSPVSPGTRRIWETLRAWRPGPEKE